MAEETKGQPKEVTSGIKATDTAKSVSALRRAYYSRIMEAHDRGEFVAWAMWGIPEEICYAMDVLPVLAENYGPVCAAKGVGTHFCEIAESDGFSMDICSYLRTGYGIAKKMHELGEAPSEAPYGGMGKPDMLIGNAQTCDGRAKWLQEITRYVDAPFFGYDIKDWPCDWDINDPELKKHLIDHYYEQLKRLVAFIEKVSGRKLDKYRLSEALQNWMKVQKLFYEAGLFRKHHPNPLPAQDSATVAFPNLHMKCWPEAVDFYQRLCDELKYRVEHNISSLPEERYRLDWHLIIPWYYIGLYNWLEQEFGATTINTIYEGGQVPDEDIIDYDFPLESIARKMYNRIWMVNCLQSTWLSGVTTRDINYLEEYDIDGVIGMLVASCRATTNLYNTWQRFTDGLRLRGLRVPTLGIEADMVDTRTYSDALVKDQIRAFMETVDAAKRERQNG